MINNLPSSSSKLLGMLLLGSLVILGIVGCGQGKGQTSIESEALATHSLKFSKNDTLSLEEIKKARFIISSSDCEACHSTDRRLAAPSYTEIANRYLDKNNAVGYLGRKIINGGVGEWGQIPMPSRNDLSKEESQLLARYILSFGQNQL